MEDLKQEAIKKAYGKYYEQCNPNRNGWCTLNQYKERIQIISNFDNPEISDMGMDLVSFRPKLLSGIENNNGWIRILEDGSNLPKEYCSCWVMIGKVIVNTPAYFNPFSQTFTDNLVQQYYTRFTHYQKIESPKPPIY